MSSNAYDQRWIRREGDVYRSAASTVSLCGVCGSHDRCNIRRALSYSLDTWGVTAPVQKCGVFVPVISFRDDTGLTRTFNTFRRGTASHRRMPVGTQVRLYAMDAQAFVGKGRVVESHVGKLGGLLDDHAALNHILRDGDHADASVRLHKILVVLYGKNYAALSEDFSVIYVEVDKNG